MHAYSFARLALGLGQLIYGPLSERVGRKGALLIGLPVFGCALATDIQTLVVLHFIQGLGGCAAAVIPRVIVRDLYSGHEAARALNVRFILIEGLTASACSIDNCTCLRQSDNEGAEPDRSGVSEAPRTLVWPKRRAATAAELSLAEHGRLPAGYGPLRCALRQAAMAAIGGIQGLDFVSPEPPVEQKRHSRRCSRGGGHTSVGGPLGD